MKPFISFLFGLMLTVAAIAVLPIPEDSKYRSLSDDAQRLGYIYQRIIENDTPIDVAFIGTSHIMNGIDDRDIQRRLHDEHINVNVANLGVIMAGRDLHLLVAKRLIQYKRPQLIVIEVEEHEPLYSHPLTPYVGGLSDIFCCRFFLDAHFPKSFLMFLKRQILNIPSLFAEPQARAAVDAHHDFGWMPIDRTWAPVGTESEAFTADNISTGRKLIEVGYRLTPWYGLDVISKISALAQANDIAIAFLYMPEYKYSKRESVVDKRYYSALGPVIALPRDIVAARSSYFDKFHLNAAAAAALAPYLACQIKAILANRSAPGAAHSVNAREGDPTCDLQRQ